MEDKAAISIKGVSKRFKLGAVTPSLRGSIQNIFSKKAEAKEDHFWALRDIDFDVKPGEVIGLIGRNGAGKSTLLKILSKITPPTTGRIEINGRVSSLLEVGTGFHPELTGSENIFLNGTILGMSRSEVKMRYDEIVAFSEIEKFIDTPVKRYSSGMYVRLAFAVAAHLRPEILIIDEVLAVGDAEFQKKCLGKMGDMSSAGRTVVFVSHNMGAVRALCTKAVFMENGKSIFVGPVDKAIRKYSESFVRSNDGLSGYEASFDRKPELAAQLLSARVVNSKGKPAGVIDLKEDFYIEYEVAVNSQDITMDVQLTLYRGVDCLLTTLDEDFNIDTRKTKGVYAYKVKVPNMVFKAGAYSIDLNVVRPPEGVSYDEKLNVLSFEISEELHHLAHNGYLGSRHGNIIFPGQMDISKIS